MLARCKTGGALFDFHRRIWARQLLLTGIDATDSDMFSSDNMTVRQIIDWFTRSVTGHRDAWEE